MSDFVPREEYEERHEALKHKYETFSRKTLRILKLLVVVLLLNGLFSAYLLSENSKRVDESTKFSKDLQASIIQNCKTSGNPLRQATRKFGHTLEKQINEELRQSEAYEQSGAYEKLFPDFNPDKLHRLLEKNKERGEGKIDELQEAVEGIEDVDCQSKYSGKSEGEEEETHQTEGTSSQLDARGAENAAFVVTLSDSKPAASGRGFVLAPPPGSALLVP